MKSMLRRIRILHVIDNLMAGGLENALVNLVQRMDPDLFEHVVCCLRVLGPNADRLKGAAEILCLHQKPSSRPQISGLVRTIRSVGPDVVHSRNWAGCEGVLAGKWARVGAVVHSEHGFEQGSVDKDRWRRRAVRRVVYELADKVLAVSHQLKRVHAERTGFPEKRISVIHNGVDDQRFQPRPDMRVVARRELGIAEEEFCIGCVGSLAPVKAHMTLLRAVDAASNRTNRWRVVFIGEGPERANLEAFLDGRSWKPQVSFLGLSSGVADLLNALDVYVLPSVFEGISNSLLEAMATGLPVLASDVGGNPEVVVNGESGILFAAGDDRTLAQSLDLLSSDGGIRSRLASRGRSRVQQHFSLKSMVQAYEQMYCELAGRRLGRAITRAPITA